MVSKEQSRIRFLVLVAIIVLAAVLLFQLKLTNPSGWALLKP